MLERTQPDLSRSVATENRAPPLFPLEARALTFEDRGRTLVKEVTLQLEGSRLTAIMGANGAGKSLLLRLLHGLLTPTCGEVLWAGRPADENIARRQAMVFQRPAMLRRSAEANLRFVLARLPASEQRRRVARILEQARLEKLAGTPARLMSGGEQQRLALARALLMGPSVLFLDEPCASLDPASTHAVEEMIRAAHDDGTKIVMVTHDIGQARRLADEVVFLHRGHLLEHAPAERFFAGPASAPARDYLAGRIPL